MLMMTLALTLAGPAALPAGPQTYRPPVVRTTRKATPRKRTAARKPAPKVRMVRLTGTPAATTPYRLTSASVRPPSDAKYRIVSSQQGMPCGTTGAPVCPSNGITLVSAPIN